MLRFAFLSLLPSSSALNSCFEEWDESCREAFGNPAQREQVMLAMETHWKEVERLEGNMEPAMLALLKEMLPLKTPQEDKLAKEQN